MGLILFIFMNACLGFAGIDRPSVVFSCAIDTLLEVSHLCLLASRAALISLLLTTWNKKMKNPYNEIIDDIQLQTLREQTFSVGT